MNREHPSLHRGEIIDLISPLSNNSADHDIAFAYRVCDAVAHKFARGGDVCRKSVTSVLDAFDAAVNQELPRVSNLEFNSHEACKHFASKLRSILNSVTCDGQAPCEPSDPEDVAEPIYQVREALVDDPAGTWRDVGKRAFDAHQDTRRRVLYARRLNAEQKEQPTDAEIEMNIWPELRLRGHETLTLHDCIAAIRATQQTLNLPQQIIDQICYLATEIRFAKSDDAAQAVIDTIRAMLATESRSDRVT